MVLLPTRQIHRHIPIGEAEMKTLALWIAVRGYRLYKFATKERLQVRARAAHADQSL